MIVAKFGGSSVKDDQALLDCVSIVEKTPDLRLVVISATFNTTNELEQIFKSLQEGDTISAKGLWDNIVSRHSTMANQLGPYVSKSFEDLARDLREEAFSLFELNAFGYEHRDHILSFGERISSALFFWSLEDRFPQMKVQLFDITKVMKTDSSFGLAKPNRLKIKELTDLHIKAESFDGLFITQGFIGIDDAGMRTTLGREGSDYTATLMAEALGAKEVHIWTDVDGIYSTDPKVVPNAYRLDSLSYDEATLLAKAGAKVLFPKTLQPLVAEGIPLKVGKASQPEAGGTWIAKGGECSKGLIGITLKERTDGVIITLVGKEVDKLEIELSEIDRGECYRSFFHQEKNNHEVLNLWYQKYFL